MLVVVGGQRGPRPWSGGWEREKGGEEGCKGKGACPPFFSLMAGAPPFKIRIKLLLFSLLHRHHAHGQLYDPGLDV